MSTNQDTAARRVGTESTSSNVEAAVRHRAIKRPRSRPDQTQALS